MIVGAKHVGVQLCNGSDLGPALYMLAAATDTTTDTDMSVGFKPSAADAAVSCACLSLPSVLPVHMHHTVSSQTGNLLSSTLFCVFPINKTPCVMVTTHPSPCLAVLASAQLLAWGCCLLTCTLTLLGMLTLVHHTQCSVVVFGLVSVRVS